jgi:hypothetical protein
MTGGSTGERRAANRLAGEHGIVQARVRPGHDVSVVNVSAGGALVHTAHRLMPGAAIELQLMKPDERVSIRGRVLRCGVERVRPTSICYRSAIGFDRNLPWYVDEEGRRTPQPSLPTG